MTTHVHLKVNGQTRSLDLDPRVSVLDALRDHLGVMSVKKGCDHGQCGACTVLVDGQRVLSCLCLAASYDGAEIVTAEGLGTVDHLGDMQQAFLEHDGFQCGYCTPGQICSAVGMLGEYAAGMPSHVTPSHLIADVNAPFELSDEEIRERMSGNLCRCGAYVNIVAAIREVADSQVTQVVEPLPVPTTAGARR
ncbi:2Fe-2S iron-sulfur cluster-binding protein [Deinococcus sp.]|uniref:2Fe-2S iron-sulfur cluster-binding protein n=1 Tax=Deinococcus sp. TaxID=47478 RepID=UPI0025BF1360|nr:2Fe-2S iron-sulfur cluster-binding protein [Deinococcus sp.]